MADIKVYGTLRTMATDGIVATTDQLKDTNVGKFQETINQELAGGIEGKQDAIADLEQIRSLANSAVQPSVLQAAIADFITKSVDDLVNYYKKSETYTKTEVNALIGAIKQFTYRVAPSLPTASESTMYIIYLIPSSNASTQNVKDEFITIQNGSSYSWEQIGSTKIDLSDYSTTEEMNAAITSALNSALSDYYDKAGVDELLSNYAHKDGFYETLGAGTALNLQGNTSKDATFTYRTAGGTEDIASGLATIHNIKGNTVVWNQLLTNNYSDLNGRTVEKIGTYYRITYAESSSSQWVNYFPSHEGIENHKIFISFKYNSPEAAVANRAIQFYRNSLTEIREATNGWKDKKFIYDANSNVQNYRRIFWNPSPEDDGKYFEITPITCIDLTLMFGAGNEPSTIEEFDEWLEKNIGKRSYYEYNEGTIINANAETLQTIGFNQWDGSYSVDNKFLRDDNSELVSTSNAISDYIPIFENTTYYINKVYGSQASLCFYDKNKQFISGTSYNGATSKLVTSPSNAAYLRFTVYKANKDSINLNLSWSGIKNGEYEPYWKRNYNLYLNQIQGYDSNDNLVTCFPDGMKRVGDVYDEIIVSDGVTKAIKRVGSIDLGTLNWSYQTYHFVGQISDLKSATNNDNRLYGLCCEKYVIANVASINENAPDKTIKRYIDHNVLIRDTDYGNSAAKFKTAMDGVILEYELETPIEYTLVDFDLPLPYKVDDFGTEETKKDTFSLSPTFAITYGVNAVDTLRRLPTNYISKESMQNFLNVLGVQMGGTWSMTLDNNEYKFSFVANPEATTNDEGV